MKRYKSLVADNARWDGFEFRPGDIVISTPPKCGTTWTQMLCALLVLDVTELERPLAEISPWLDMLTNTRDDIVALLDAQAHRRVIKTHTPLDGLPYDDKVIYVCVGRDPRDVSLSWDHHMANLDLAAFITARAAAVGLDDLEELGGPPEPPPDDPVERFWRWVDEDSGAMIGVTLSSVLGHFQTFWDRRDDPAVALFHYGDMQADLPGQVRRLAGVLGIDVTDQRAEEVAAAASFDRMKQDADRLAPDIGNRIWLSNTDFFHRGSSGQWRDLLDADGLRRYEARVAQLAAPDLAAWAHHGWSGAPQASA